MPEGEQRERMGRMLSQAQCYDIGYWTRRCVALCQIVRGALRGPLVDGPQVLEEREAA